MQQFAGFDFLCLEKNHFFLKWNSKVFFLKKILKKVYLILEILNVRTISQNLFKLQ